MGRFKEKMYRFMYGRYGTDSLYNFLCIATLILIVLEYIIMLFVPEGLPYLIVSLAFSAVIMFNLIWSVFRTMSRNTAKRRRENERYIKLKRGVLRFFSFNTSRRTKSLNRDDAVYIFRDCTSCGSVLRLPRRVGRHKVKCPKCSRSFYVRTKKFKIKKR